ncbi:hypothetical protein ACHQM5_026579 [Ranunculus cassubicifolius]
MKFPQYFSTDGPLVPEMKKLFCDNFKKAIQVTGSSANKVNAQEGSGISEPSTREVERRASFDGEDPIRIVMFLGSWSHT